MTDRDKSSKPLLQRLKDLGQGGFDLDFDALDKVTKDCRAQCIEAEKMAYDAADEIERLLAELAARDKHMCDYHAVHDRAEKAEAERDRLRAALGIETAPELSEWYGPGVTYPCGCRSAGPNREPPWYCAQHNGPSR